VAKYDGLGEFLRSKQTEFVPMTFKEIERVTGVPLPPSARYRAWWSNNSFNNVMTKVWLEAGFRTEQVDMASRKLVFRRISATQRSGGRVPGSRNEPPPKRHPLFGALKSLLKVTRGTDLTKPADPSWSERS
jgi:hypothetical protein